MNPKAKDSRPKIIHFRESLRGVDIVAERSILWPCHAFSISIPVKTSRKLNVFEETILKLTEMETGDTRALSNATCLDMELVAFIQNRLYQLELLTSRHELTDNGKVLLNEWKHESRVAPDYAMAIVLMDLHSGKILPYIIDSAITYEKIERMDGNDGLIFSLGTKGAARPIHAKRIPLTSNKERFREKIPSSDEIAKVIKEFNKKIKRNAFLELNVDRFPAPIPTAEAITINETPELIYLHCKVLVQTGNPDIFVTDGRGFGFSEIFASHLRTLNLEWLISLKSRGIVEKLGDNEQTLYNDKGNSGGYKFDEISKRLADAQRRIDNMKELNVSSSNEAKEYKKSAEGVVTNLYAAIEWALRQVVTDNPVDDWERIFLNQSYKDNEKLLRGFAGKVGFLLSDDSTILLQVKPGAIRQIEYGKVEMQPLLALALAGANGNAFHPMNRLAFRYPTFLSFVLRLLKLRNPIEHGSSDQLKLYLDSLLNLNEETKKIVILLIPGVTDDLRDNSENIGYSPTDVDQERLKANIELDKLFGLALMYRMGPDLKEQLMRSEMYSADLKDNIQMEFIKCLASSIQLAINDMITDRKLLDTFTEENIMKKAFNKLIEAGFASNMKTIPDSVSKTNPMRVSQAVRGLSPSLGANMIALMILCSTNELLLLNRDIPNLLVLVANLIDLRGHGNRQRKAISKDELLSLKNEVFHTIKILMEV